MTASMEPEPVGSTMTAEEVARRFAQDWSPVGDPYADSPFAPLKALSSRRKGARMEAIVHAYLQDVGYKVGKADSSDYDRRADQWRVEVKGSFLWGDHGEDGFRWQQIRVDQDYDFLIVAAFWPDRVDLYACTHAEARKALHRQDEDGCWPHNQHGGKGVDSGTYFIQGLPQDFPWLAPLDQVLPAPAGRRNG